MAEPTMIPFSPVIPFHGDVKSFAMLGPIQGPMEFDGWREESQSWKDGAYLGAALGISPIYSVKGPQAERFFSDSFVNDFIVALTRSAEDTQDTVPPYHDNLPHAYRHTGVDVLHLGHVAHFLSQTMSVPRFQVMPQHAHPAFEQLAHTVDHRKQRGLAGAVGTDDTHELTARDFDGNAAEGDILPVRDHGIINNYQFIFHYFTTAL